LNYFMRLLDDLFFIADIAEPSYKKTPGSVDLQAMLNTEINSRKLSNPRLQWSFRMSGINDAMIAGDAHLILRLVRNTLDNAARYARGKVGVVLAEARNFVEMRIEGDGPGIDQEAIHAFGVRRKHRVRSDPTQHALSLGLGSVIIRTIIELHGGTMRIESGETDSTFSGGTAFVFVLPK